MKIDHTKKEATFEKLGTEPGETEVEMVCHGSSDYILD